MNVDPRDTVDHAGTNPNRGMRTQPYMISILVALVLLLVVLLLFVFHHRGASTPVNSPGAPATKSAEP